MKPLTQADILDVSIYEEVRDDYRARVLEHKRDRRAGIGDRVTLVFEDRETLRYQIQEMARIERLSDPERIQDEIDVYNDLIPRPGQLSATLFIEIPELEQIRSELERLIGLDEHLCLVLGDDADAEVVDARFDPKQMEEDRLSAVQYVRFELDDSQVARFAKERVRLRIHHPNYAHESEVSGPLHQSLLRDLTGDTPSLLDVAALSQSAGPRHELLFENESVRAIRPSTVSHCVVVEARAEVSLLEAEAPLLGELMQVVQRYGREIAARHGRCHISAESGPGQRLRFRLAPGPGLA